MSAPVSFDPSALTDPVDRAAVRASAAEFRARGFGTSSAALVLAVVAIIIGAFVFIGVFGSIIAGVVAGVASAAGGRFGVAAVVPFVIGAIVIGVVVALIRALIRGGAGTDVRRWRLDRFARANAMTYVPSLKSPELPGMIFRRGDSRVASDLVRGDRPRFVEFANYRYTTGSGKNRSTHRWGYVAVKLDTPLPHIVLDALSNNGLFGSNLPQAFDRDQRLRLEGDFDEHFALYCPRGYERDALYLFTPDVMARFIDNAAALDVEIVDDWLFLYAKRDLSTLDPATWAWLFGAVGAVLDKLAQWGRWRDDHLSTGVAESFRTADAAGAGPASPPVPASGALPFAAPTQLLTPPPPGVAEPGRRLKRRTPVAAIVFMLLFGAFWVATQFGLLGRLFG